MFQLKLNMKKTMCIQLLTIFLLFFSYVLSSSEVIFSSYTSANEGKYNYVKSPLGCNYAESWKKDLCEDGSKWSMETTINSYVSNNGRLEIDGYTKLINNNAVCGFTGGTFVIAKNSFGEILCIIGAKNNFIIDSASATKEEAQFYGWGVDPGKIKFYRWKPYVDPKVRTCSWHVSIPSYVMELNPHIEIVQTHTPSERVLVNLNEFMQYTLSFAIYNGADIITIVVKANYGVLTFTDITHFIGNVIYWAKVEKLIGKEQGNAAGNIVNAIEGMYTSGLIGLVKSDYNAIVGLIYTIQTVINDRSLGFTSIAQILSYIKTLSENSKIIVPSSMEYIEVILVNLKVLIKDSLSQKQLASMDKGIALVSAINNLPDYAVSGNLGIAFDSISVAISLSQQSPSDPEEVKIIIDPVLSRVSAAVFKKYGQGSMEMENFLAFKMLYNNFFEILKKGGSSWNKEYITLIINAFSIYASSISNKDLSSETLNGFSCVVVDIINENGGWSSNNDAISEILTALQYFEQYQAIKNLKKEIQNLK